MSGIYGIYRYDGAPVEAHWLERMRAAMAYYGPDGGASTISGSVGMGHLLFAVNPEDAFEKQPMRGERGLVVTSARLDNRDALLEAFHIPAAEAAQTSDGHLVSRAFDRWGEELCPHLQGDWALAAWDARARRLFLARDALGGAALYYYEGKGYIAFASSLKALLALPGTVREPDLLRLAEILVCWTPDAELTAYKGFRNLDWAHALSVAADGRKRIARHWSPEGRQPLRYRRDEDYVEAFLEHYTRAVRSCLRTQKPIAAELSAGRDSGSVVALAAPLLAAEGRELTAFTAVPLFPPDGAGPKRLGNEWELAHATATMAGPNVKHLPVDAQGYGVLAGVEHFIDLHDGPSHSAANHYWCQAVLEAASRSGFHVLLGGVMGNLTVSWDGNQSAALALLQRDPATAFRILVGAEANLWLTIKRQILKPLVKPCMQAFRSCLTSPRNHWRTYSALSPAMADELNLDRRMKQDGHDGAFSSSPFKDERCSFFQSEGDQGFNIRSESNAGHSVSCILPVANLELLNYLLRLPDHLFYREGQRSYLLQRSFRGRMPDPVLLGRQRGLQAADLGHRILRELGTFRECLRSLEDLPEARGLLDLPLLHRCLDNVVEKVDPNTTADAGVILLRGLGVGLFLRRLANPSAAAFATCEVARA